MYKYIISFIILACMCGCEPTHTYPHRGREFEYVDSAKQNLNNPEFEFVKPRGK